MGSSKNRKEKRASQGSAPSNVKTASFPASSAPPSAPTQPTASAAASQSSSVPAAPTANPNDPQSLHIATLCHLPPSDLLERALSGNDPDLLARLHKVMTTHNVLKHVLAHVPEKDRVGVTAYWLTQDPRHLRNSTHLAPQADFVRAARTRREAYCSSATCPQCLKEADGLIEDAKKLVAKVDLTNVVRGRIESQVDKAVKAKMDADRQAKAAARAAKAAAATAQLPSATKGSVQAAAAVEQAPATQATTPTTSATAAASSATATTRPTVDPMLPIPSAHAHAALTLRVPLHRMTHRRRARQRLSPRQLQYPHRIANGGLAPDSDSESDADMDVTTDPHALLRLASDLTENHAHQFLSTMQKLTTGSQGAGDVPAVTVHGDDAGPGEPMLADHILAHLAPAAAAGAGPRPLAATHFDPDADSEWLGDDDVWLSCTGACAPMPPSAALPVGAHAAERRGMDRGLVPDWDVFGESGLYGDAPVVAAGTKAQYPPGVLVGAVNDPVAHAVAWAHVGGVRAGEHAAAVATPLSKVVYDAKHLHMVPVMYGADQDASGAVVSAFKHTSSVAAIPPAAGTAQGKSRCGSKQQHGATQSKGELHADDACCEWHHEYTSDEDDAHDEDEHDEIGASESDAGGCDHDHEHCDESFDDEDDDEHDCHGEEDDEDDDEQVDDEDEEQEEPGARADDVRSKSSSLPSCATGPVPCGSNCIHHTGSAAKLCARHAKGITYPSPPASDADTSKDRPDASAYLSPASRYTLVSIACEFLAEHVQYQYRQYISERAAQQLLAEERAAEERKADAKRRRAEMHAAKKEAKRLEREAEERKERERIEAEQRERERKEKEREEKRKRQAEAKAKVEAEKLRAREEREKKAEAERAAAEAKRQAKAAAQAAQAAVERAKAEKAELEKREREEKEQKAKEEKEKREREERERKEKEERERKDRETAAEAKAVTRTREASTSKSSVVSSTHSSRKPSVEPMPVSKHPPPPAKAAAAAAAPQAAKAAPKPTTTLSSSRASPVSHDKPLALVHQPPATSATPPSLGVSLPLSPSTARIQLPSSNGSSPSVSVLPVAAHASSGAGASRLSSPVPAAPADHDASSPTTTGTPSTSSSASSSAPNTLMASHQSTLSSPIPSAVGKPPHGATPQQPQQALPSLQGVPLQQQQDHQHQMYPPPPAFAYQQALAMGLPMFPGGAPGGNPQQFLYNPAAAAAAAAMAAAAAAAAAASGNTGAQFGLPGMYAPQQQQSQQFGRVQAPPSMHQHQQPGDASDYGSAAPSVAGAHSDRAMSQQLGTTSPSVHLPPPPLSRESTGHALPQQFQSPTSNGAKFGLGAEAWGVSPIGGTGMMGAGTTNGSTNGNAHHSLFDGLRLGTTSDLASTLSTTSSTGGNGTGNVTSGTNPHLPGPINTAIAAASGSASAGNLGSALLSGTSSIWSPFAASDPFDDLRSPTAATASVNSASMAGSRFANLAGVQQAAAATTSTTSPPSSATAASATASPWGPPVAIQSPPSTVAARATAASYRGLGAAALPAGLADALDMDDDMFDPFGFPSKPAAQVQSQFSLPQQQQQARSVPQRQQSTTGQQYQQQQQQSQQHHAQQGYRHGQSNGWSTADVHHSHPSSAFGYAGAASGLRAGQQHHQHAHHIQQPPSHQHAPFGHHQQHPQQQQYARGPNGFPPGSLFARNQQQVDSHAGGY